MPKRIIRGFSRIGIGVTVLVTLAGAGVTVFASSIRYSDAQSQIANLPQKRVAWRVQGYRDVEIEDSLAAFPTAAEAAAEAAGIGLGVTALLALSARGIFRGLGWVLAGFSRD